MHDEPARMVLKHWTHRAQWLDQENEQDKTASDMEITFVPGKGNKLVDAIVPKECVKAMDILVDSDIRKQAGVEEENQYIFANTGNGWETTTTLLKMQTWTVRKSLLQHKGFECLLSMLQLPM